MEMGATHPLEKTETTYTVQEPKRRPMDVKYMIRMCKFKNQLRSYHVWQNVASGWGVCNPCYIQNVKRRNVAVIYDNSCFLQASEDGLSE
jgi:hypothetical protein